MPGSSLWVLCICSDSPVHSIHLHDPAGESTLDPEIPKKKHPKDYHNRANKQVSYQQVRVFILIENQIFIRYKVRLDFSTVYNVTKRAVHFACYLLLICLKMWVLYKDPVHSIHITYNN
jgi:hypothetical protein